MNSRIHLNLVMFMALVLISLFVFSGCSSLQPSSSDGELESVPAPQPYYPSGVNDIQIPADLDLNRKESMFINTASYSGGIMSFKGRLEIGSLSDFFSTTMQKNGWKQVGAIRYENVLLAFVKPNKSCIISIYETNMSWNTKVYIYVTEDIQTKESSRFLSSGEIIR